MFDIGFLELLVCMILALLVLGPERLPKAARTAGLFIGRMRRTLSNMQDELERQVRTEELREKLKDPYATFSDDDAERKPLSPPGTPLPAQESPATLPDNPPPVTTSSSPSADKTSS